MRVVRRYVNDSLDIFLRRSPPQRLFVSAAQRSLVFSRFRLLTVQN